MRKKPTARATIRPFEYRGQTGYSISGTNRHGRSIRVFCRTPEGARIIKAAAKRGNSQLVDSILRKGG